MIAHAQPPRDRVFISYCHQDRAWLERLQVHLAPLARRGLLQLWDDTRIQAGEQGANKIAAALQRAKVAVLLVSADYFASDDIAQGELAVLLQAAAAGEIRLLWVPVRASLHQLSELASYKAAHSPAQPLAQLPEAEQEAALVQLCQQILDVQKDPLVTARPVQRRLVLLRAAAWLVLLCGVLIWRSTQNQRLPPSVSPRATPALRPPDIPDADGTPPVPAVAIGGVLQEIDGHVTVHGKNAAVQRVTAVPGIEVKQVIKGDVVLGGTGSIGQDIRSK